VSYATALADAPVAAAHHAWRVLLAQLTIRGRAALLTDLSVLAEFIETIGGPEAATHVLDSIDEAGRWWP